MQMNNEWGITLVELLAAIVISAIIGVIGYSLLFNGFSTYDRVKVESELRDEADLIMISFLNELYTLKSGDIVRDPFEDDGMNNYIELENEVKIGFIENQAVVKDRVINIRDGIELTDRSEIRKVEEGQYIITLELEFLERNQKLETKSEIGIIVNGEDDTGGGEGEES